MKIFKNLIKDIADTGKPISDFRKKVVTITKIISSLSYQESKYSPGLTWKKLQVEFLELQEIAERCPANSEVRMYFEPAAIETNIPVAILAIQKWINYAVLEGNPFTNTAALALIQAAEKEVNAQNRAFRKPKPISDVFPAFFNYKLPGHTVVGDNSLRMELKFSSSSYISYNDPRNSNSHLHTIIEKNIYGEYLLFEEFHYERKGYSGKVATKKYKLEKDKKLDYYRNVDQHLHHEIFLLKADVLKGIA
ncbi:hypothetical protein [uncultured Pontibacter sp.]|uniref:hypothetical protein n=1 Tax=uncultured Pontibacter sp. TaxID=453356 RepID=UPI002619D0BF|nr:hypothetical protein [uncultured Pontibacter sp.]